MLLVMRHGAGWALSAGVSLAIGSGGALVACGRTGLLVSFAEAGEGGSTADAGAGGEDVAAGIDAPVNLSLSCPGAHGLQAGAAWPMHRRCPGGNAESPVVGPRKLPTVAWTQSNLSTPLVAADGTLYASTDDPDPIPSGTLHALAPDGSVKWAHPYTGAWGIAPDGIVLSLSGANSIAFEGLRPDGSIAWSLPSSADDCGFTGVTVGGDGTFYFLATDEGTSCTPGIHVLSADGSWTTVLPLPAANAFYAPSLGTDGSILFEMNVPSGTEYVNVLEAMRPDGTEAWRVTCTENADSVGQPVVAADGTIYLAGDSTLSAVRADGRVHWQVPVTAVANPTLGPDGTVYLLDAAWTLLSVRPDGTVAWRTSIAGDAMQPGDEQLVVGGDGTVYVPTASSGAIGGPTGTAAIGADGAVLWQMDGVGGPAALGPDGTLYTWRNDGTVSVLTALSP